MIFNKRDVEVKFNSYPKGAKVFIDGEEVGETPVSVMVKTDHNKLVLYAKNGYANREFWIKKVIGDSRLRPKAEYTMCIIDAVGSILILPIVSVLSDSCAHFDSNVYSRALDKGGRSNVLNQNID